MHEHALPIQSIPAGRFSQARETRRWPRIGTLAAVAAASLRMAAPALGGQVEEFMSFQARLTDSHGDPLPDGDHMLDFFVYDSAVAGQLIGVVLNVQVHTTGGTGIVSTAIGPVDQSWFDAAPRFLGLTIDDADDDPTGDELAPRVRLTAVPFALRATSLVPTGSVTVQSGSFAADLTVGGAIGIGTNAPSAQLHLRSATNNAVLLESTGANTTPAYIIRNDAREWQMRVSGDEGDQFELRDATASEARLVVDASGRVGIGHPYPYVRLHVRRNTAAESSSSTFWDWSHGGGMLLQNTSTGTNAVTGLAFAGGASDHALGGIGLLQEIADVQGALAFFTGGAGQGNLVPERLRISASGNVGIGTASPLSRLQVNGDFRLEGGDRSILTNTADGSDTEYLSFSGAGATSYERGANLRIHGNEASGAGGVISYQAGNATGAQHRFYTHDGSQNAIRMLIDRSGRVGVGTASPSTTLNVSRADSTASSAGTFWNQTYGGGFLLENKQSAPNAVTGIGLAGGSGNGAIAGVGMVQETANSLGGLAFYTGGQGMANAVPERLRVTADGNVGIGTSAPVSRLHVNGTMTTKVITILGGSDLAEPFNVGTAGDEAGRALPGMVVVIDPASPGRLKVSSQRHDRKVAGVISGANGLSPGLVMSKDGDALADGAHPVALTGRVWCWCDASPSAGGEIEPGDLLTTSDVAGHAMRVTNLPQAQGAIIGKAMTPLKSGERGLVLVLISLQ